MSHVALVASVLLIGCGPGPAPQTPDREPESMMPVRPATSATEGRFTGKITSINFGCAVDASCDLVVDGTKHVHFGHDSRGAPPREWGTSDDLWPLMELPDSGVGRTVEVFAATTDQVNFTLAGKAAYYIKLVP